MRRSSQATNADNRAFLWVADELCGRRLTASERVAIYSTREVMEHRKKDVAGWKSQVAGQVRASCCGDWYYTHREGKLHELLDARLK